MPKQRLVIYPKDVQLITGRSERYGRKVLNKIRQQLGKEKHHYVTINEFSHYSGIEISLLLDYIK